MNPRDSIFYVPPYTSVPDYVGADFHDPYLQFSHQRPQKKQKDNARVITHPTAEIALKAAKQATKEKPDRYFGRNTAPNGTIAFNVYENGKVAERHVVSH